MNRKKDAWNWVEIICLSVLVICIYIVMLFVKGVYPFGGKAFIFVDDGYQQNLATLYYIWDVLHGRKALFFDFDVALGSNMAGMVSHFGMLSPINLLYLFIPRNDIIESTTWMLLLRIVLAAFSMRYLVRYVIRNRLNIKARDRFANLMISLLIIIISLAYAYSSWLIRYFMFFQWIDEAIVLPVCLRFFLGMFQSKNDSNENKKRCSVLYAVSLALMLMINIQQAYAILMFMIIISGCQIFTMDKLNRKKSVVSLGIYTVIALLISSSILIPASYQISNAARMDQGNIVYIIKQIFRSNTNPNIQYDGEKRVILSSVFFPIILMFFLMIFRRVKKLEKNKKVISDVMLVILMILPVYIESIHYIWQGGEYIGFPLRYGEIIVLAVLFSFTDMIAITINQVEADKVSVLYSNTIIGMVALLLIAASSYNINDMITNHLEAGDYYAERDMYYYGEILYDANIDDSVINRYKNEVLASNSTLISGLSGNANFMHFMSDEFIRTNKILGYEQLFTRLSDEGGTAFTDALLGYRYAITKKQNDMPDDIYTDRDIEIGDIEVSELEVTYPFGIYINEDVDIYGMADEGESLFCIQNAIYDSIIYADKSSEKRDGVLFKEIEPVDNKNIVFDIPEENDYITYMYIEFPQDRDVYASAIEVYVSDDMNESTYSYDRGILPLYRLYGHIEISIDVEEAKLHVAIMDMDKLKATIPENVITNIQVDKKRLLFDVINESDEDRVLFLPLSNFEGKSCEAVVENCSTTSRKLKTVTMFGSYVGVIVPAGFHGSIDLRYHVPGIMLGYFLCIIGVALLIIDIFTKVNLYLFINKSKIIVNASYFIFCMIVAGLLIGGYMINLVLYIK